MTKISIICMLILFSIGTFANPIVSWFNLYPIYFYPESDNQEVHASGANYLTFPASANWSVRAKKDVYDYSFIDSQIKFLYDYQINGSIISEINPLFTQSAPWLIDEVVKNNQNTKNSDGTPSTYPSILSPIFLKEEEEYAKNWLAHVNEKDPEMKIKYIHPGAEWWFMPNERYGDLDIAAFKNWLKNRYKTIDKLNNRWQSNYKTFDEVNTPKIDIIGNGVSNMKGQSVTIDSTFGDAQASLVSSPLLDKNYPSEKLIHYRAGREYLLRISVKSQGVYGGAYAECAWSNTDATGLTSISGTNFVRGTSDKWVNYEQKMTAPQSENGIVYILLKLVGHGKVLFDNIEFIDMETNKNLLLNGDFESDQTWLNVTWSGKENASYSYLTENNSKIACIEVAPKNSPYKNVDAAIYDFQEFWYTHAADYINKTHGFFKKYDKKRKMVSYLTQAFNFGVEWDGVAYTAISPDYVGLQGKNIDELGLQVCSADGDDFRITSGLDLMRKYNKRLWGVDLVDFTSGVYIGEWYINKMTQNAVCSGAEGIVYCGWNLYHMVDDYSYKHHVAIEDLNKITTNAKVGIEAIENHKAIKEAAIIEPILPASSNDINGYKNNPFSFMGWYKILKSTCWNTDIITFKEIENNPNILKGYSFVLVPDCRYISETAAKAISNIKSKVFFGGDFGEYNEIALPYNNKYTSAATDYGYLYSGELTRNTHAGNTPPLLLWGEETKERIKTKTEAIGKLNDFINKLKLKNSIKTNNININCTKYKRNNETVYYIVNQLEDNNNSGIEITVKNKKNYDLILDGIKQTNIPIKDSKIILPSFITSCVVTVK